MPSPGRGTFWRRLRRRLTGNVKQRVTRLGFAYTAATIAVGVAAFGSANNLLFLILSSMLALLVVSGFVSRLSLAGLELSLVLPQHVSARVPFPARVRVRNHKAWMPSFSIHLEGGADSGLRRRVFLALLPNGATIDEPVTLEFARRGEHREDAFVFSTRFPFGFTERRVPVVVDREIVVYPSVLPRPGFESLLAGIEGGMASRLQGRGDDFHRIRPYEHNESARHVDWKSTAHTGKLQVREYVRRERPSIEIALDLAVPEGRESWFELAVDCCAYLVWSFAERDAPFRLRTQQRTLEFPGESSVYDILKFLALVTPRGRAAPLEIDADESLCVVFSLRDDRAVRLEPDGAASARP